MPLDSNRRKSSRQASSTRRLGMLAAVYDSGGIEACLAARVGSQFSPLEFLQLGHECLGVDDRKTQLVADI
jgi:hypothetical protein